MISTLFWIILRSVAVPFVAILLLRETPLGEEGAFLAVGIALFIATVVSIGWNGFKLLGNTLLLRVNKVSELVVSIVIQLIALASIWYYYFSQIR